MVDELVGIWPEGGVSRVDGVGPPPDRGHVDHADVVEVGGGDAEDFHEPATIRGPGREQDAVDGLHQAHEPVRHVAHVDDAVVGEDRGMAAWVGEERRVVAKGLERGLGLDRPPEALLERRPERRR